ncbi:MAG: YdjY domain-containing protein [Rubripirellula sp.]
MQNLRIALCLVFTWSLGGIASLEAQDLPTKRSLDEPLSAEEKDIPEEEYVPPEKIVREAFKAPPGAKQLSKQHVWIDRKQHRVYVDGYVAMQDGSLEMFACPMGTKEHESVIATLARSKELHTALLAVGAQSGTPVSFVPDFVPATGQRIRVWICYYDKTGEFQAIDGRKWVRRHLTDDHMKPDWVFAGSGFWKDESSGREFYRADSGDMICVSNFSTAMMDVPIPSSAEADDLQYVPYSSRIPKRGTPIRLVLVPIPLPTDKPDDQPKVDVETPPTAAILPRK